MLVRRRAVLFDDWQAKCAYLDGAASVDARRPYTRQVARWIAVCHDPNDRAGMARDLFVLVRDHVKYVHDPDSEEFSDSDVILSQGYGDCDDKARAFVALCRSLRLEAQIRPVLSRRPDGGDDFTHVQARVRWPGSYQEPKAGPGGWLVAELILAAAELGDEVQDVQSRALS
jgi:transglutaminase-like putative cysteine protease